MDMQLILKLKNNFGKHHSVFPKKNIKNLSGHAASNFYILPENF